ncbi:MAG: aldehyde dehydrogenase family protein [Firmicutes bacterium]|nr:aldehyde dehydrogenase family protein [Bacillota bacterium]
MKELLDMQRTHYASGATRRPEVCVEALKKLQISLRKHEAGLLRALEADLGKSPEEGYMTELGATYGELRYAIRHARAWLRPRLVPPSMGQFPGFGRVFRDPYGVALILSPWNYPALLSLVPVIAAVATGNCAVLRPSSEAPKTAECLDAILRESFTPQHVSMVLGDTGVARRLTALPFDKIFFTGSAAAGREIMAAASQNLVPVTLELGGKSPVIVAADADIRLASRRIIWAKCLNAGQTCVAPDYVLVQKDVESALLEALRLQIEAQFGSDPLESPDLPPIVNRRHFERLEALLRDGRLICGGQADARTRKIAPTVLTGIDNQDPVMREEIFGPILPVLPFLSMEDAIKSVRSRPAPLALYLFTADKDAARHVTRDVAFGGGCVNDCAMHLAGPRLPFGGVGESGMGAYHGRAGFACFTREKPVFVASTAVDIPLRYAPRKGRLPVLKRMLS